MRFVATLEEVTEDGRLIFRLPETKARDLAASAQKCDYEIELTRKAKPRSLQQNALLWKIIGDINITENGSKKTADDISIYKNILKMAGVGVTTLMVDKRAVPELEKLYRLVEVIDEQGECAVCKCYIGTSQMDSSQMSSVISTAITYAENIGLDMNAYD